MTAAATADPSGPGPAAELAVETHGLTKRFGRQNAVDGVDLAVPLGSVFGFLGPNGSGKTTTIRVLLGLASATAGHVRVLGREMPRHVREVLPASAPSWRGRRSTRTSRARRTCTGWTPRTATHRPRPGPRAWRPPSSASG